MQGFFRSVFCEGFGRAEDFPDDDGAAKGKWASEVHPETHEAVSSAAIAVGDGFGETAVNEI